MITKYAISSAVEHANVSLRVWVKYRDVPESGVTLETSRLYDTEAEGIAALAEFRATYNERNYVPRSGLVAGKPEDWHLWKVEYHSHAERVS